MRLRKHYFFIIFLFVISISFTGEKNARCIEKPEVDSIIAEVEKSLKSAYTILLEAEKEGVDVKGMQELVALLNIALGHHSEALEYIKIGDYDSAALTAENVVDISRKISEDALPLIGVAQFEKQMEFRNQLLLSSIISSIIVITCILSWFFFKKYYIKRMMKLGLVVNNNES